MFYEIEKTTKAGEILVFATRTASRPQRDRTKKRNIFSDEVDLGGKRRFRKNSRAENSEKVKSEDKRDLRGRN